jgi:formamidase
VPTVTGGARPDEIITGEIRPDLVREARRVWGVENNIYQLGHRGYVAVAGGARDCPYSFMQDLVAGRYRLPWEDDVVHRDGTSCGFPPPVRAYSPGPPGTVTAPPSERAAAARSPRIPSA